MNQLARAEIFLPDPDATAAFAQRYADVVQAGDAVLLSGPIGAGKTHFARALIQAWLQKSGAWEDVPSPTFTLVQTYTNGATELWHADLYRLNTIDDVLELGLEDAFEDCVVLVEWPDRLGDDTPQGALSITFAELDEGRRAKLMGPERLVEVSKDLV